MPRPNEKRSSFHPSKGISITHVGAKDEGIAFLNSNNEFYVGFELWPDIQEHRASSSILGMRNPEYEYWVKAHTIDYLQAEFQRDGDSNWYHAISVDVGYGYLSDTSAFDHSDMRDRRSAASFEGLPSNMRLANRQYIFHFIDSFAQAGTRVRVSYSLKRPDGSRAVVDTTIHYTWREYMYLPDS